MHALIIGATGATGKDLLEILLQDNTFQQVDIFVRRKPDVTHPKLNVHVINFDEPDSWQHLVKGDVLFSCLGTTLKAAGSKEAQWKIDFDYQYRFAKAARENSVPALVLVSSAFANARSFFFYSKLKGALEVAVKRLDFPCLLLFKPPTLVRKDSERTAEVLGVKMLSFLNKLGLFSSQKPLPTHVLAQAMIHAVKANKKGVVTFEGKEIWHRAVTKAPQ